MKNSYCKLTSEQIKKVPERFLGFMLSPFQHNLRNEMVHVPEDTFQEMIDIIAEYALQVAAATPPSPSTAEKTDAHPIASDSIRLEDAASPCTSPEAFDPDDLAHELLGKEAMMHWKDRALKAEAALASRPAEASLKPMRERENAESLQRARPAEVDDASAKAGGQVGVAQAETRMDAGFQPVVAPAPEVDDEGLPPLPESLGLGMIDGHEVPAYTAEQYRQGQRDAVAADRARRAAAGGGQ